MRRKEFNEYIKLLNSTPDIMNDGTVKNNMLKNFILTDESTPTIIVGRTAAEGIYSAVVKILQTGLSKLMSCDNVEYDDYTNYLSLSNVNFEILTGEDNSKSIKLTLDYSKYDIHINSILSNDDDNELLNNVYRIKFDNNVIIVWESKDDRTTICSIVGYSTFNFNNQIRVLRHKEIPIDEISKYMDKVITGMSMDYNIFIDYATVDSSDINNDNVDEIKDILSYKRVILKKIKFDKRELTDGIKFMKNIKNTTDVFINSYEKSLRKLKKRNNIINKYVSQFRNQESIK